MLCVSCVSKDKVGMLIIKSDVVVVVCVGVVVVIVVPRRWLTSVAKAAEAESES